MTALENVMVGRHVRTRAGVLAAVLRTRRARAEERAIHEYSGGLLEYVGVASRSHDLAHNLPYGDQRRLEIVRALATKPKLLLLDEPAAGMNLTEKVELTRLLDHNRQATIRLDGRAIAEHTQPDVWLKPNDMVNVGTNFWALPLAVIRNGFRASYGFGFVLDRNISNDLFGPPPTNQQGQ